MTIDVDAFRTNFPEFAQAENFPGAGIQFWLDLGYVRMSSVVWGTLLDTGVQLYVAHNMTLERQSAKTASFGGIPGQQVGPLNSKSISKVSAGYDSNAGAVEGAGNYNNTNYGTRLMELVKMVGAQGITQVGADCGLAITPWGF